MIFTILWSSSKPERQQVLCQRQTASAWQSPGNGSDEQWTFWKFCWSSEPERSWGNINPKQLRANVDLNLKDRNEIDNEIDLTGRHFLKISTNRSIKFNSNFYSISYPLSVISLYHNTLDFRSSHSLNCFLKLTVELVIIISYTKNDYLIELITLNVSK